MAERFYVFDGRTVIGEGVHLSFEEPIWATIICNFLNGKINAAKGLMGEELMKKNGQKKKAS